jgi:hypothetical protein
MEEQLKEQIQHYLDLGIADIKIPEAEKIVEKMQEETSIIASEKNIELITIFFQANHLIPGVEVSTYRKVLASFEEEYEQGICTEKFYNAVCIKYEANDLHIGALLINLAAKHHGLENMLIDYLHKLKVSPIIVDYVFTKPVTNADIENNFLENVVPKLKETRRKKIPVHKSYTGV